MRKSESKPISRKDAEGSSAGDIEAGEFFEDLDQHGTEWSLYEASEVLLQTGS